MTDWYSVDNLKKAWKYAKLESRDDFVFDVIDHSDIKHNINKVFNSINAQLKDRQYYPAPILHIPVPKNDYSVRPGTTISLIDLIVLYAIMQQLAPSLDAKLCESAYAYRLNPSRERRDESFFKDRMPPGSERQKEKEEQKPASESIEFPYDWFRNWLAFHRDTLAASQAFQYVAITDITAFFENVSLNILFQRIRELLGENSRELIDRLVDLMQYWDWSSSSNKTDGKGLPQGSDVSSFLSNIYLRDLDEAMLTLVNQDTTKYFRYVDDVRLYTNSYNEARRALVELERRLRTLGLNVQSAKTKIKPAKDAFDPDVTQWEQYLDEKADDKLEWAQKFIREVFNPDDPESLKRWERIYKRSLTIFSQAGDDLAVPIALAIFLKDPSSKTLIKNFAYLRQFVTSYAFEDEIYNRLIQDEFSFDFHTAYLYRLAAYSRRDHSKLRELALATAIDSTKHWFTRTAALMFLSTCDLEGHELHNVGELIDTEGNYQVLRTAYVILCQYSGNELGFVLDKVSFFNAPHQEYLRRYFLELTRQRETGLSILNEVKASSIKAPSFIHQLHKLDLTNHWC